MPNFRGNLFLGDSPALATLNNASLSSSGMCCNLRCIGYVIMFMLVIIQSRVHCLLPFLRVTVRIVQAALSVQVDPIKMSFGMIH